MAKELWVVHGIKRQNSLWDWESVESEEEAKRMVKQYKEHGQGAAIFRGLVELGEHT